MGRQERGVSSDLGTGNQLSSSRRTRTAIAAPALLFYTARCYCRQHCAHYRYSCPHLPAARPLCYLIAGATKLQVRRLLGVDVLIPTTPIRRASSHSSVVIET